MLPRAPFIQRTKMSEEEQVYCKKYMCQALWAVVAGWALFIVFVVATYFGVFDYTKSIPLETVNDRVVFAARHLSLHLLTILLSIHLVICYRLGTPAMNPLYSAEWEAKQMAKAKNVLTNNIEHGLVMIGTTLLTAIDLSPSQCARYIPAMTWAYFLGRILFFFAYPHKRSIGVIPCNCILVASVCFNVYNFVSMYAS